MSSKELVRTMQKEVSGDCCPQFHPERWDNKTFDWDKKQFIKDSMLTLFHIPYPPTIDNKIRKMMRQAEDAKALDQDLEESLLLFMDPSAFRSEIFLSVTHSVPGAENTTLSGTFMSLVFEGVYKKLPKYMKEMDRYLKKRDLKANNYYVHYAYCPQCAEEVGTNYMVLFAQLEE